MISCGMLEFNTTLFLTSTRLTPPEFQNLLPLFGDAYRDFIRRTSAENKVKKRKCGGGRKPKLLTDKDKHLFILIYFKLHPLQTVIGYFFGMSQGQACIWVYRLSEVLKTALSSASCLPVRIPENLRDVLQEDGTAEFAVDGTERKIQRPGDPEKQKKFFKRKKEDAYRKKQCRSLC